MNTLQSCSFLCLALAAWSFASQAVWLSRMALAVPFCVSILQCIKPDGPENLAERLRQELVYGWMVCWHESTGIHRSNSRFPFPSIHFFLHSLGSRLGLMKYVLQSNWKLFWRKSHVRPCCWCFGRIWKHNFQRCKRERQSKWMQKLDSDRWIEKCVQIFTHTLHSTPLSWV